MIEIDGSQKSGSGTILRMSVALATIQNEPLHITNIRQNRPQPGLKPQHLESVLTAARLCNAKLKGASLNSRELWYTPSTVTGGNVEAKIGTAGSIPMLILTILPICAFSQRKVQVSIKGGGTDVQNSPTINYMRHVLLPTLKRMGFKASISVVKYGYYPKGMGEVTLTAEPCRELQPLRSETFGIIKVIAGISVCTHLADRKVAERQAKTAETYFKQRNMQTQVQIQNDVSNPLQKGSSITLWTETDTNTTLGADAIGEIKKPSETVGEEAARRLWTEIEAKPTVDIHLADILIPYFAMTKGESTFLTRTITEHLETNIWLAQTILGAQFNLTKVGNLFRVERTA